MTLAGIMVVGCQSLSDTSINESTDQVQTFLAAQPQPVFNESPLSKYQGKQPRQWGEKSSGVAYRLKTDDKVIALTFDACGGSTLSNGFDTDLISYLDQMKIPATLFISGQWINANRDLFLELAANPLFEIANHGYRHLPSSVDGRSAYGIKGTDNMAAAVEEIEDNQRLIESLTGKSPAYYRSGTNFYDEITVQIARDMGIQPVGYYVLGDAGATFTRRQVGQALQNTKAGSIVIFHFNHPEGFTAEGIHDAIPKLLAQGYKFVKLSEYELVCYP